MRVIGTQTDVPLLPAPNRVRLVLGYQHLELALADRPPNYRYPFPESYQVFFVARVAVVREFASTAEAAEREFFESAAAADIPWVRANRALYDAAAADAMSFEPICTNVTR